jgi:hypothetical protein
MPTALSDPWLAHRGGHVTSRMLDPMSEVAHEATGFHSELGALLVLLHGADARLRSVQATYTVWRHNERAQRAFVAAAGEQKRRGASTTRSVAGIGQPQPAEHEETVRIWRDAERFREERDGGHRDGYYAVAVGSLWWIWDKRMGAMSNQDDPSVGSGVGQRLRVMLDPTSLLSSLRFRVTGRSQVAGRATVRASAAPRPQNSRHGSSFDLHELGVGAHRYELDVDQERGTLLAVTAIRDEQPFHRITTLAIRFEEPIPAEIFQFKPPEGEEIQPTRNRHRPQHVMLTEAQQRAPFTVLMPDRVPADWQAHCTFFEGTQRPACPSQVSLSYRSDDGHQSVSISQMAVADRALHHYENMVDNDDWQEEIRDGTSLRVRPAGWGQTQAYLERDGTFAFLVSDNLTGDELATLAAGLRAAPSTPSM